MTKINLASDQLNAFRAIENDDSPWYVTGAAGTGKSALLNYLFENSRDAGFIVKVAFTGAAAVNIDGQTAHSLALQSSAFNQALQVYAPLKDAREISKRNFERLATCRMLIIDEISMIRADMLDALDRALRMAKNEWSKPFGGARLVMFGDMFQLPPFVNEHRLMRRERKFLASYPDFGPDFSPFFFEAHVLSTIHVKQIRLTINKRQQEHDLANALDSLRTETPDLNFFNSLQVGIAPDESSVLFAERKPAHELNARKLLSLPGERYTYGVSTGDNFEYLHSKDQPFLERLELKVGAQVMVIKNLNFEEKLVNGATGEVVWMKRSPDSVGIKLHSTGKVHEIGRVSFDILGYALDSEMDNQGSYAEDLPQRARLVKTRIAGFVQQIPLVLAYGMTIHKAQGKTLDQVAVSFREHYRQPGQAYVALSRVTNKAGLKILGTFTRDALKFYDKRLIDFVEEGKAKRFSEKNLSDVIDMFELLAPWRSRDWLQAVISDHFSGVEQLADGFGRHYRRRMLYLRDNLQMNAYDFFKHFASSDPLAALTLALNIDKSVRQVPLLRLDSVDKYTYQINEEALDEIRLKNAIEDPDPDPDSDLDVSLRSYPEPTLVSWLSQDGMGRTMKRDPNSGTWTLTFEHFEREQDSFDNDGIEEFVEIDEEGESLTTYYLQAESLNALITEYRYLFRNNKPQKLMFQDWHGSEPQLKFVLKHLFVTPPDTAEISLKYSDLT